MRQANRPFAAGNGFVRVLVAMAVSGMALASATITMAAPPSLPPRPTVESPSLGPGPIVPRGAWIQLRAQNVGVSGIEIVVQWQDGLGAWHDVDGWRGEFDTLTDGVGIKTWWLDEWLFGAPNFRWIVYEKGSGKMLVQSGSFTLPIENRQTVSTAVVLNSR